MYASLPPGRYPHRWLTVARDCYWDGSNWDCELGYETSPPHASHALPPSFEAALEASLESSFEPFTATFKARAVSSWLRHYPWLIAAAVIPAIGVGILIAGRLVDRFGGESGESAFFIVGAYFLPTLIAASRNVRNVASVAVINAFLGWTLVGWVVALAMAVRTR